MRLARYRFGQHELAALSAVVSVVLLAGRIDARADVTLNRLFSDHAVLQKAQAVNVWGKGTPGENVSVTLNDATAQTTVGTDGKWKVQLDLGRENSGPHELKVQAKNFLKVKDVLVGEVWLCSGQSNMEFPLGAFPVAKSEVPVSANSNFRQFQVKKNPSPNLLDDVDGEWLVAGPATSARFTAVGYFFGQRIQKELNQPVGLINSSFGGTIIEAWMSNEALTADAIVAAGARKSQTERLAFDEYTTRYKAWQKKYGREDTQRDDPSLFASPDVDTSDWQTVTLPGLLSKSGYSEGGAIWVRRKIPAPSLPDISPKKFVDLFLDNLQDSSSVYWNGKRIGRSELGDVVHRYGVKGDLVTEGENVLALRLFSAGTSAGVAPGGYRFQGNHVSLKGEWLAKAEYTFPAVTPEAMAEYPQAPAKPADTQNVAAYLFNGMINPLIGYSIRGVIWYQGESNINRGYLYRTEFPLLISDWRTKWGLPDLPFFYCQIANLGKRNPLPEKTSLFAELREAQTMTLKLPNTGQAVLIDAGEEDDIHPADKKTAGDRLAAIALAKTYKKDVAYSGPAFDSMTVENDKIRVRFLHNSQGLVARKLPETYFPSSKNPNSRPLVRNSPQSELEGFSICGEDRKWFWAEAKIEGDSVVISSDKVPKPIAVRYAWAQNPICNLYNGAGLPAGPFRTDDFPLASQKAKY